MIYETFRPKIKLMNYKYCLLLLISGFIIFSCSKDGNSAKEASHESENAHNKDHSKANKHMHRNTSIEELIKRFDDPEREEWQKPDEVIDMLGDLSNKTVLDIGAGSGYFSFRMAAEAQKVIAADVESKFLNHIQSESDRNGVDNLSTLLMPYSGPDSLPEGVDLALIVNTYHHIENRVDYFERLREKLSDGSELVVVDFKKKLSEDAPGPPESIRLSYEEVRQELKKAGFRDFSVELELLPYQYILWAKT